MKAERESKGHRVPYIASIQVPPFRMVERRISYVRNQRLVFHWGRQQGIRDVSDPGPFGSRENHIQLTTVLQNHKLQDRSSLAVHDFNPVLFYAAVV